jgi:ATP-binding cassette subfamily F protein 3
LVDGLNAYGGAVVLVSHDRDLVDLVADRLWLVADGTVAPFDGDIDGYRDLVLKTRQAADEPPKPEPRAPRKPSQAERARIMGLRRALRDAESVVERLGNEQARLDARLADPTTYGRDGVTVADLAQQRSVVAARLAEAEDRWLAAQAAIEAAGPDAG